MATTNYLVGINGTDNTTYYLNEGIDTRLFRGTCTTTAGTAAKVATLDEATNFSLTAGVRVMVTFQYGNSALFPTLNVNSTGAKSIAYAKSATEKSTGEGTTHNSWGAYESVIFTYDGTYWVNGGSSRSIYNAFITGTDIYAQDVKYQNLQQENSYLNAINTQVSNVSEVLDIFDECLYEAITIHNVTSDEVDIAYIHNPSTGYPLARADKYLPLSGGTMTGSIVMNAETSIRGKIARKVAGGGGWAYTPYVFLGNDNADFAHIGAYGSANTFNYMYLGANGYDGNNLRISSTGTTSMPRLRVWSTDDVGGATAPGDTAPVVIGSATSTHLEIDSNEILAKTNGTTPGTLWLQDGAGTVGVAGTGGLTVSGGLVQITKNSNTVTIGSQNASWCHIYNSASIPFIFNNTITVTSNADIGTTSYRIGNLYLKKGRIGTVSIDGSETFVLHGPGTYDPYSESSGAYMEVYSNIVKFWATSGIRLWGGTTQTYAVRPYTDNTYGCGLSSYRWSRVYAGNSSISTSDRKEKDITGNIDFAQDLIMSLEPVDFMWKKGDHRRKRMGFIAQDVAKICNNLDQNLDLVNAAYKDDEEGDKLYLGEEVDDNLLNWGLAYEQLIAPMVKVMQNQQKEINELKALIQSLI